MSQQSLFEDQKKTSHAHRGKECENLLEKTHYIYLRRGVAKVDKNPEEWRYCNENEYLWGEKNAKSIFAKTADGRYLKKVKSQVDFSGSIRGQHIAFDAKQSKLSRFDLDMVERHQEQNLRLVHLSGGIAGIMLYLSEIHRVFFIPYKLLDRALIRRDFKRGPKSISLEELQSHAKEIPFKYPLFDYLDILVPPQK